MSIEPGGWSGSAWLLLLSCTGALACVALLRRPCRRLFGAESAFLLWILPPLAMAASLLPHAPTADAGPLSGAAWVAVAATGGRSGIAAGDDWSGILAWSWLLGAIASLSRAAAAQWRFRLGLRDAAPVAGAALLPVVRARSVEIGPALVGAWRPCIVVPADFEARYTEDERALVLAHEGMHARRRDGWWSLLAQWFASLLWFHPLAWWALPALRHDQELACDAAVLRERGGCRRVYANAMLKTPAATQVLPVGCSWSSRHPLTERIAMLKSSSHNPTRRRVGGVACLAVASALAGVAYAASAPAAPPAGRGDAGGQYQLDIQLALASQDAEASHARHLKVALCMAPGKASTVATHGVELDATTRTMAGQRVSVDLAVRERAGAEAARNRLEGALDEPLHASGTVPGGNERYTLEITPRSGCPASATTSATGPDAPITMKVQGSAARQVVGGIATQAGLVPDNPEAVDERGVALRFQAVPAVSAMQMVAAADGMRAVFDGRHVRFEPGA
jgi:beta-lactamase regulating signal transducer with metallopeptidase domain